MGSFVVIGFSLFAIAVGLAVYEVLGSWSGAKERAAALDAMEFQEEEPVRLSRGCAKSALRAVIARISGALESFLPVTREDAQSTRERLRLAGLSFSPESWRVLRLLAAAAPATLIWFGSLAAGAAAPLGFAVAGIGAVGGWFLSDTFLDAKRKERRILIEATLPDAMDLLGVALAAGSPVEQCFKEVASGLKGPLSEEFSLVDREVNMLGISREEALRHLADRCASQEVSAFVAQILQAINQGSSITDGLAAQSSLARECAQAAALEEIRKMPTKLDVILSVCFLPPTTVLVLVPTVVRLLNFLQTSM